MSTGPRAARGGKKVLSTPSPQLTSSAPPILTEGPIDLSSFLSSQSTTTGGDASGHNNNTNNSNGSFITSTMTTNTTTTASSSVVVRGRARENQSSVKEREPAAKQSEIESKLRSAFATLVNKSEQEKKASADESEITAAKVNANAVSLIAESHAQSTAIKILKDSSSARVLIVTSLEEVVASSSSNNAAVAEGIKVGSFFGAEKHLPSSAAAVSDLRLCYTTFRSAISFLNVFYRDIKLACPFTHIILVAKEGKCSPLFDAALSILSTLIFSATVGVTPEEAAAAENKNNNKKNNNNSNSNIPQPRSGNKSLRNKAPLIKKSFGENVKIVLAGVNSIEEIKNSISAPDKSFTLAAESLTKTEWKHAPVMFSSSEAAALAGTVVKEHSPSSISLRRLPGSISSLPQSLIEHGVNVATSVLVKAVQAASSEKLNNFRCAVIGAELSELQTAISAALPADSFKIFTEVKDFIASASNSNKSGSVVSVLLLSRALGTSAAAQLGLHLVVDSGTERRAQIPPQSEMQFPIKVVLAPTRREAQARKSMAGWCEEGPGLFIAAADFTATASPKPTTSASSTPLVPSATSEESTAADTTKDEATATTTTTTTLTTEGSSPSSPARGVDNTNTKAGSKPAENQNEIDGDEEDLLEPVCDAVLTLAQNNLELTHLVRDARKGREAQLALALPFLTDLGFITQGAHADLVITTFLGEICARSGLPPDFACIVINGLACGLTEASVFVATAAARPFRAAVSGTSPNAISHENEFGDTIEDAITLAEGVAAGDDVKKYLESRPKNSYPIHQESFEACIRVAKIVQRGIEDFIIPSSSSSSSSSSFSAAAIRKQITDNVNLLVAFVASALARRAVVIRHEGDERINTVSRGNLLFTHTAKEVLPNRFVHSGAGWKKDMVVICSSIQNTPTRLLGSGCTGVSNDFFMGCLFALSPFIAYEQISSSPSSSSSSNNHHNNHNNNNNGADESASTEPTTTNTLVSVSLNRLEKTSLLTQQLADQLIKLREQWKTLMSYVQLRRATGAKSASHFKELAAKHLDKRFNLENAQAEYIAELCELISDFHVNVPLGSSNIGRDMSRVRSHILCAPAPPSSLASIAVPTDYAVAKEIATMAVVAAAAAADNHSNNNATSSSADKRNTAVTSASSSSDAAATTTTSTTGGGSMGTKEESIKIGDVQNPIYEESDEGDEGEADVIIDDE